MPDRGWAFAFAGSRLLLTSTKVGVEVPDVASLERVMGPDRTEEARRDLPLPAVDNRPAIAFDLGDDFEPQDGLVLKGLRKLHGAVPEGFFRAAGTAKQHLDWLRHHRFCSRCGAPTERHPTHRALACVDCGQLHFPRLSPAVIVLVERGREILLGRSPHFPPGVYSTLAGFVEPGESLEECIDREIQEEVGVRVRNLRYFGSQPHPFPHSLMVGFTADWASGEIDIDPTEIEDAGWFGPESLPLLPHPMSIARALIEDFLARMNA
jgi:NAD+ diphosphatase